MANSYLTRTPSSGGNRKTFTISSWFKRSKLGDTQILVQAATDGSTRSQITLRNDEMLQFYSENGGVQKINVRTNRVLRDTSAWYHVVVAVDTTQGTASNRVKIYINGVQETSLHTAVYGDQNYDTQFNHTVAHTIGRRDAYGDMYFQGYQSHFALVDGTALTSTTFGSTDSTSGIWKFKPPSGVTWGTNGVHLKFENSGALGTDSSGGTNTYTVNGNLKQALDTPSNVYATLNALHRLDDYTLTEGNNTFTNSSTGHRMTNSTLAVDTGKWYAEVKVIAQDGSATYPQIGIIDPDKLTYNTYLGASNKGYGYLSNGNKQYNNSATSFGNTYTVGDIIGIAMDLTNNKIYFSKNGTFQASGNPASGATGTGSAYDLATGTFYSFGQSSYDGSQNPVYSWNFGNGFFGTTAITSAGSNGNGSLFEYDVPSGYYALNTKNINTYG
jgi:hypothetical protein